MADPPIHFGLVKRVLLEDRSNLILAGVESLDDNGVLTVRPVLGGLLSVVVTDHERVAAALSDTDGSDYKGLRLAFINENYQFLGLAFGPANAPSQLKILAVLDLESHSIPSLDEQPGWRLFRLRPKDRDDG